jgi:hypothetical protein
MDKSPREDFGGDLLERVALPSGLNGSAFGDSEEGSWPCNYKQFLPLYLPKLAISIYLRAIGNHVKRGFAFSHACESCTCSSEVGRRGKTPENATNWSRGRFFPAGEAAQPPRSCTPE